MAIIETTNSKRVTWNLGLPIVVREFHVEPYAREEEVFALFNGVDLPDKGEKYQESLFEPWPAANLKAQDFEVTRDPNVQQAWIVRITYLADVQDPLNFGDIQQNQKTYATIRASTESRFHDAYRQWNTTEALVQGSYGLSILDEYQRPRYLVGSPDSDIGGVRIDVAGNPTSILRNTTRVQLDFVTNTRFPIYPFCNASQNAQDSVAGKIGTRNKRPFLGFDTGQLVFLGVDIVPNGSGRYTITFNFEGDFHYHLQQVPKRNPNGHVLLDMPNNAAEYQGTGQAKIVSWVQPFPVVSDFRTIHPYFPYLIIT